MCDCSSFADLSALLSALPTATPPVDLFHGGCFPQGAQLSTFHCGMWCSDTFQGAEEYARWGKQPGMQTGVIHLKITAPMSLKVLPQSPLTFLKRHYGMNYPAHRIINRDLCCTLGNLGVAGLVYPPGQEWFLCHADQFATVHQHTVI